MREPILSLTDSPETPSLFLSHSAIIWRKPGEGRGWKKGWKRNRWNFRASRHNARRISLTRLGKQEKNALISRFLPPSNPSFVPGQYERCAGKRISSRFPLSYPPFSPPLFFFSSLPFSNPSAFALVPISIELSYGKQFLLTILHSILLHTLRIFFFSFFFSIGLQISFFFIIAYTRVVNSFSSRIIRISSPKDRFIATTNFQREISRRNFEILYR